MVFYLYNKEEFEKKTQKIHTDIKKTYPQDFCCLSFVKNNTQAQEHISTNLKWEVLPHPPYSPDLAPSDFYLFRVLDNEIKGKFFKEEKDLKLWIQKFFDSKQPKFFKKLFKRLVESWESTIKNNGEYYDD